MIYYIKTCCQPLSYVRYFMEALITSSEIVRAYASDFYKFMVMLIVEKVPKGSKKWITSLYL